MIRNIPARDEAAREFTLHMPLCIIPTQYEWGGTHRGPNILGIGGKCRAIGGSREGLRDQNQRATAPVATFASCARPEKRSGAKSTGAGALWPFPCWYSAP